ncbi:hypothetical protein Tco_0691251 [Tanacetum coccineum]
MPLGPVRNEAKVVREEEQDYDIPLQDGVMQPLTLQTVHITPPNDDYVEPVTNPFLDKHLNEFGKDFFNMIRVDENGNFIEDIKELSIKTHVECATVIQKLLNRVLTANDGIRGPFDFDYVVYLRASRSQVGGYLTTSNRRTRALEQETQDLDVENRQKKNLKASYGITTPQELRRNQIKEEISHYHNYGVTVSSQLHRNLPR